MPSKTFLYIIKIVSLRTGAATGSVCGVIHANSAEEAQNTLSSQMGANACCLRLLDVTERNGEAYVGIPSGEVLSMNAN